MSKKIDALLIDLNGTLHVEDTAIPGSQDAIRRLRAAGVRMKFVTNTTEISMRILLETLVGLGFDIREEEIFSALTASVNLIKARGLRPYLIVEPDAMEDLQGIDTENPNAVLIGLAPSTFNYNELNTAFRLLLDGADFIAMIAGRYYPRKDGLLHLGPGPFVKALEFATERQAELVGKPATSFYRAALEDMPEIRPEHTLMVGDDVRLDVESAMEAGLQGVLVKTGKYRAGDEAKISVPPSFVFDNFAAVADYVLSQV